MSSNEPQSVDLETIKSGNVNGVAYGPNVRVFARTKTIMLIWVPGHSYYSHGNHQSYAESNMRVVPRHEHGWRELSSGLICRGERLKMSLFRDHADRIDSLLGDGVWRLLEPRKTLVLDGSEPFSGFGHEMSVTGREFGYETVMKRSEIYLGLKAEGMTGLELDMTANKKLQEWHDAKL